MRKIDSQKHLLQQKKNAGEIYKICLSTSCIYNEYLKGMVNCQNLLDKGPPECNSARG